MRYSNIFREKLHKGKLSGRDDSRERSVINILLNLETETNQIDLITDAILTEDELYYITTEDGLFYIKF